MELAEQFGTASDYAGRYGRRLSRHRRRRARPGRGHRPLDRLLPSLGVPLITVVIGEGGSGGAIAIATANRILMLEHAIYTVASPEAAASILWRDSAKAIDAATNMKITAQDLDAARRHRRDHHRAGGRRPPRPRMVHFEAHGRRHAARRSANSTAGCRPRSAASGTTRFMEIGRVPVGHGAAHLNHLSDRSHMRCVAKRNPAPIPGTSYRLLIATNRLERFHSVASRRAGRACVGVLASSPFNRILRSTDRW